jgi:hypothetical protein
LVLLAKPISRLLFDLVPTKSLPLIHLASKEFRNAVSPMRARRYCQGKDQEDRGGTVCVSRV